MSKAYPYSIRQPMEGYWDEKTYYYKCPTQGCNFKWACDEYIIDYGCWHTCKFCGSSFKMMKEIENGKSSD